MKMFIVSLQFKVIFILNNKKRMVFEVFYNYIFRHQGLQYLTPLSTIFRCIVRRFYQWRNLEYPEKTTDKLTTCMLTFYIAVIVTRHDGWSAGSLESILKDFPLRMTEAMFGSNWSIVFRKDNFQYNCFFNKIGRNCKCDKQWSTLQISQLSLKYIKHICIMSRQQFIFQFLFTFKCSITEIAIFNNSSHLRPRSGCWI